MKYTFGNNRTAAGRLEDVAAFFNPLSAEFVKKHGKARVDSCLDLGCGPGFSTDMLARALDAGRVCGLDNSGEFLEAAGERFPRCEFIQHDVTRFPFPLKPDVMYARFLLTHLAGPVGLVNSWVKQLAPGGVLFIEEVESIATGVEPFIKYLEMISSLLDSQSAELYIGKTLADGAYEAHVLCSEQAIIPAPDRRAAGWFHMNTLTVFENERFIIDNYSGAERQAVADGLRRIMESNGPDRGITWTLRRMALRRE